MDRNPCGSGRTPGRPAPRVRHQPPEPRPVPVPPGPSSSRPPGRFASPAFRRVMGWREARFCVAERPAWL